MRGFAVGVVRVVARSRPEVGCGAPPGRRFRSCPQIRRRGIVFPQIFVRWSSVLPDPAHARCHDRSLEPHEPHEPVEVPRPLEPSRTFESPGSLFGSCEARGTLGIRATLGVFGSPGTREAPTAVRTALRAPPRRHRPSRLPQPLRSRGAFGSPARPGSRLPRARPHPRCRCGSPDPCACRGRGPRLLGRRELGGVTGAGVVRSRGRPLRQPLGRSAGVGVAARSSPGAGPSLFASRARLGAGAPGRRPAGHRRSGGALRRGGGGRVRRGCRRQRRGDGPPWVPGDDV